MCIRDRASTDGTPPPRQEQQEYQDSATDSGDESWGSWTNSPDEADRDTKDDLLRTRMKAEHAQKLATAQHEHHQTVKAIRCRRDEHDSFTNDLRAEEKRLQQLAGTSAHLFF